MTEKKLYWVDLNYNGYLRFCIADAESKIHALQLARDRGAALDDKTIRDILNLERDADNDRVTE